MNAEGMNRQLSLSIHVNTSNSMDLHIYSPYWIINKTQLPLHLGYVLLFSTPPTGLSTKHNCLYILGYVLLFSTPPTGLLTKHNCPYISGMSSCLVLHLLDYQQNTTVHTSYGMSSFLVLPLVDYQQNITVFGYISSCLVKWLNYFLK